MEMLILEILIPTCQPVQTGAEEESSRLRMPNTFEVRRSRRGICGQEDVAFVSTVALLG